MMRPAALHRRLALAIVLAAASAAWGCAHGPIIEAPGKPVYAYRVGPGDVLLLDVFDEPLLTREVTVTPDGLVTFPLAGQVRVQDRSLSEVAELVVARLVKSARFADAKLVNLSVTLKISASAQVQVLGEVLKQGSVPFRDRLSVVDAVAASGGLNWGTAKMEDVRVIRGSLESPVMIPVDLEYVFSAADKNVYLMPGDIVVIPPKCVTRFDRYCQQLLSPLSSIIGSGRSAAASAAAP